MGRTYDEITPELKEWLARQRLFFVGTAPLAAEGMVNCSPKGLDTLRLLGPLEVAYLDLTGSGIETVAHVRENGRIVLMFCAFEGAPRIVRLHGTGEVVTPGSGAYAALREQFPGYPGERAIIHIRLHRVSDSCGYGVPRYEYTEDRDTLVRLAESFGEEGAARYRAEKNVHSLDGLPGLEPNG